MPPPSSPAQSNSARHGGWDPSPLPPQPAEAGDGPRGPAGFPGRAEQQGRRALGQLPGLVGGAGGSPPAASSRSPLPTTGQDGAIGQEAVSNATGHQ